MIIEKIQNFLAEKLGIEEYLDCFVVDISFNKQKNKIEVFIDSDSGFNVDKCRKISRHLESKIDQELLLGSKYVLEVSSPGLDRPLLLKRQYFKNKGRLLKIQLNDSDQQISGRLTEIDTDHIILELDNEPRKILFNNIKVSKVIPSFKK